MTRFLPLLVFVAGLGAAIFFLTTSVDRGPFESGPVGRELTYWSLAGSPEDQTEAVEALPSPLYLRLLAPLAGEEFSAAARGRRVFTAMFLTLFASLVVALAWKRAGAWPSVVAGLGAALAAPVVLSSGAFSPGFPASIAVLGAFLVLDGRSRAGGWAVAGGLVGLAALFHATLGWASVLVLALVAWFRSRPVRRELALGLFLVTAALVAGLGTTTFGGRTAIPLVRGVEIYRGHGTATSGAPPLRNAEDPRRWWSELDYFLEASRDAGRRLSQTEADLTWARRGLREELTQPIAAIQRAGVKLLGTLGGEPLPRSVSWSFMRDRSQKPGHGVVTWVGRILIPLGLVGILLARRRAGGLIAAAVASGIVAAGITYADPDTRQVTLAALLVGTALFLRTLAKGSGRDRVLALVGGGVAVGLFGIVPGSGAIPGLQENSDDHYFLGALYEEEKQGSVALREFERSLRLDPTNPYPRLGISRMLARDSVTDEAIRELERLRINNPQFINGLVGLCRLYERQRRFADAAAVYGHLMTIDPWNPEYPNNLGTAYVEIGYYEQAVRAFKAALEIDGNYASARANLEAMRKQGLAPQETPGEDQSYAGIQANIVSYLNQRNFALAQSSLTSAYERYGRTAALVFLEGTMTLHGGDAAAAIPIYESIKDSMATNVIFLYNLGAAYASSGKPREAESIWKRALELQPANEKIRRDLKRIRETLDSLGVPVAEPSNR